MFGNKITAEIETNQQTINTLQQTIDSLQTIWKALQEQETTSYSYIS